MEYDVSVARRADADVGARRALHCVAFTGAADAERERVAARCSMLLTTATTTTRVRMKGRGKREGLLRGTAGQERREEGDEGRKEEGVI